jgi:hypothetical protein
MQVTLNIEAGQLGDTIVDLFKNLSDEQREALALQVLEKWVEEPTSVEKDLAKVELLRKYRCKLSGYIHGKKYQTDEEILRCRDFQKELNNVKTSKELMIRDNAALEVALEQATADFPILLQRAMTTWFADHIQAIAATAASQVYNQQQTQQPGFDLNPRF